MTTLAFASTALYMEALMPAVDWYCAVGATLARTAAA